MTAVLTGALPPNPQLWSWSCCFLTLDHARNKSVGHCLSFVSPLVATPSFFFLTGSCSLCCHVGCFIPSFPWNVLKLSVQVCKRSGAGAMHKGRECTAMGRILDPRVKPTMHSVLISQLGTTESITFPASFLLFAHAI